LLAHALNMKPSLCVVNYNGLRYLRETLAAAVANALELAEIIVFDNASTDGSAELAEREFPSVKVVRLGENRGPAPARNAALNRAVSDRVLIVDNDVRIVARCPSLMSEALDGHPNAAIAMPSVIYAHKPDTVQYDGADSHFLGQQILHHENHALSTLPMEVRAIGSLITAAFMVDRSRLPADFRFDESFFIYFEDHDFGVRARMLGREIVSVPRAHVLHAEGTEGLSLRHMGKYSSMRVFCIIRNRWLFILRNYAAWTLLLLLPLLLVYELAQLIIAAKKGWLSEWWRSVCWVVGNAGEIVSKRKAVQRGRVVGDRQIMQGGHLPFREELVSGPVERAGRKLLDGLAIVYWRLVHRIA
jgi:GT2 family glycosyltransferase